MYGGEQGRKCEMIGMMPMGKWVLVYLAIKWLVLGSAIYGLSQFSWFRIEFLLAFPLLLVTGVFIRQLLKNNKRRSVQTGV